MIIKHKIYNIYYYWPFLKLLECEILFRISAIFIELGKASLYSH